MIPVELLLAALRQLVAALGTGVLPTPGPVTDLTATGRTLTDVHDESATDADELRRRWQGLAADVALTAIDTAVVATRVVATHGDEMAEIIGSAATTVARGAAELDDIVDSLQAAVRAAGPAITTPAGVVAILPVAAAHLARGVSVVARVSAELDRDIDALEALTDDTEVSGSDPAVNGSSAQTSAGAADAGSQTAAWVPHPAAATVAVGDAGRAVTLPDGSVAYAPTEQAALAVRAALTQQGVPYSWGGTTPGVGLDCSGLTQWAYGQAGVSLPRLAQDQDTVGRAVSAGDLAPGDLAVWSGHVAMYIGNGQMIEAGDPVSVSPVRTTNAGQSFEGFFRPTQG